MRPTLHSPIISTLSVLLLTPHALSASLFPLQIPTMNVQDRGPTDISSGRTAAAALPPFQIPTMNIQGPGPTGIPGGGTAPANVTISFVLYDPATATNTTCGATYLPADYPRAYLPCANSSVAFKFEPPYYSFGNFTLDVRHAYATSNAVTFGNVFVTNNEPGVKGNYLSCLQGAPFDGIRCSIGGPIGGAGPIPVPQHQRSC